MVYCVTFWAYLVWALAVMAWTCLARGRTFRREDLARSISLLLIGRLGASRHSRACCCGPPRSWSDTSPAPAGARLNALGDALLPWPVLVNAAGVLSLLTVPYLSALVTTWWRVRQLRPLWEAMISRYPQVHLDLRRRVGR